MSPYDPFLQVVPHIFGQLKSVTIYGIPENIQEITMQLSSPAPLLESLTIEMNCSTQPSPDSSHALQRGPLFVAKVVPAARPHGTAVEEHGQSHLIHSSSGEYSVRNLLDFFVSALCLRNIRLHFVTPTIGTKKGQLVSLPNLKRMLIFGGGLPSLLLDHLLIPASAKSTTAVDSRESLHLPKSLDFPQLFSGFRIHLYVRDFYPSIRFSGPNCDINIVPATSPATSTTCRVLESLARFDPSDVERLKLAGGDLMQQDGCDVDPVLSRMKEIHTLAISRCTGLSRFFPFINDANLCPKLEQLILDPRADGEKLDIQNITELAARRASWRGAKLKSVRIVSRDQSVQAGALKLAEYVPHVEWEQVPFASFSDA